MILLCHYNEGRVLLTDEDGMYNDFITEACRVAGKPWGAPAARARRGYVLHKLLRLVDPHSLTYNTHC